MMQDEDLGGPARKNIFSKAVTRISQVCNVSMSYSLITKSLRCISFALVMSYFACFLKIFLKCFVPFSRSTKVGWTNGLHMLYRDGSLRYF